MADQLDDLKQQFREGLLTPVAYVEAVKAYYLALWARERQDEARRREG